MCALPSLSDRLVPDLTRLLSSVIGRRLANKTAIAHLRRMAEEQLDRLRAALADRYAIERELGSGGMATVYLADDLAHNRQPHRGDYHDQGFATNLA